MATPAEILSSKFPYQPTSDQKRFFKLTEQFIKTNAPRSTFLVRGYAGTGKTSVLSALVKVLPMFGYKSLLLAPTGRASKIMAKYTRRSAFTIHKAIYKLEGGSTKADVRFMRKKNYAKNTVFIVDEASMISDGEFEKGLLSDLIKYVFESKGNKLMLVGDDAQLPPVGQSQSPALSPKHLEQKYALSVLMVNLNEVMRQSFDSGILFNATNLRQAMNEKQPQVRFLTGKGDVFKMTGDRMEEGLRYAYHKHGLGETIIICRSNKNAVDYNRHIRQAIFFYENEIDAGDQIMIVKNNYFYKPENSPMGFFANGDFAEVLKIVRFEEMYGLRFADLEIRLLDDPTSTPNQVKVMLDTLYSNQPALSEEAFRSLYNQVRLDYHDITNKAQLRDALKNDPYLQALQIKFAYALTCHKSQGGQWKAIFMDQGYLPDAQLSRDYLRWLYTGVTRATEELFLVNFNSAFFNS